MKIGRAKIYRAVQGRYYPAYLKILCKRLNVVEKNRLIADNLFYLNRGSSLGSNLL